MNNFSQKNNFSLPPYTEKFNKLHSFVIVFLLFPFLCINTFPVTSIKKKLPGGFL